MGNSLDWILRFPPLLYLKSSLETLIINALRTGPIPQHIALVMDGNRRYARLNRLETAEGHALGFESLKDILEVCYKSGVSYVTIYAFSIENFKRSKYEVDVLMELAKNNLLQLCAHGDIAEQYDIKIQILGQRGLVSDDVQEVIDRAEELTRGNRKATLNICFPYTSRDEIASTISALVSSTEAGVLQPESIDEQTFNSHLMTASCPDPDILIRTSGVERLSDFLLWQVGEKTDIRFCNCFWPDFNLWRLLPILVSWQVDQMREKGEGLFRLWNDRKTV